MTLTLLLGATAVVLVGGYAWSRRNASQARVCHSWCCPRCDKRIRYPSSQAGRTVACPACRRPLALPRAHAQSASPQKQVRGYRLRRKPTEGAYSEDVRQASPVRAG